MRIRTVLLLSTLLGICISLSAQVPTSSQNYIQEVSPLVDDLSYTYDGNQLIKVEDSAVATAYAGGTDFRDNAHTPAEYAYDANGNMTSDANKGITGITYNRLNLPEQITFSTLPKDIDKSWGKMKEIEFEGTNYKINWQIRVFDKHKPNESTGIGNEFKISNTEKPSKAVNRNNGIIRTKTVVGNLEKDSPMAHELGHLLGLSDKYVTDSKSKYYQKPISKEWEGNIMAMPSGEGSVNLRN